MTNELEKQFLQCFGIEPKKEYYCPSCDTKLEEWKTEKGLYYMCGNCCECDYVLDSLDEEFEEIKENLSYRTEYPQISDRILLELICILNSVSVEFKSKCVEDLKREILGEIKILLEYAPNEETAEFIKHQVRTLFEEEK